MLTSIADRARHQTLGTGVGNFMDRIHIEYINKQARSKLYFSFVELPLY
jgi:hypothetical protein